LVEIKGLEKFAPQDYPGMMASTVFLGSCNFRCPYCHNADLVLNPGELPTFPMEYFVNFLDSRKEWIEGICVTGGEPLLHQGLEDFLSFLKQRGLSVKLDTNGSFPSRLARLLRMKLLDMVAMDVKAPLEKYEEVVKAKIHGEDIRKSTEIILDSGVDYVFRTTVVPGLVGQKELMKIGRMLRGAKIFQVQKFVPANTLDPGFEQKETFSKEEILIMAEKIERFFDEVKVKGV
jgi:pyruvate formate lyase activating enzyme